MKYATDIYAAAILFALLSPQKNCLQDDKMDFDLSHFTFQSLCGVEVQRLSLTADHRKSCP